MCPLFAAALRTLCTWLPASPLLVEKDSLMRYNGVVTLMAIIATAKRLSGL
jgi:hypothetical protein